MAKRKCTLTPSEMLFAPEQRDLFEKSYEERLEEEKAKQVECLGLAFPNDEERRQHFLGLLREKLKDPDFRKIEGFPIGSDEDILALSDPPYYTACPNPFIEDFIKYYGKPYDPNEPYSREPFAFDVNEGRHEPVYLAHTYHAKVPYRAVLKYILAYTEPGDLVYDGFAGTGMTGVACHSAENPPTDIAESIRSQIPHARFGQRLPILADLSPIASFLAGFYNVHCDKEWFVKEAQAVLDENRTNMGHYYQTRNNNGQTCEVKYFVWSDVFICPECSTEILYASYAYDRKVKAFVDEFDCQKCKARLSKQILQRAYETVIDPILRRPIRKIKQSLFSKSYVSPGGKRTYDEPSSHDFQLLGDISQILSPEDIPSHEIPYMHMTHERNNLPVLGITHIHHFFT